jgi:phenylalanyl-tRNA synthetase beta chain
LEIKILSEEASEWLLQVPTYRTDVLRDVDVIEDVLRIYGYNNVEIGENLKSNLSYKSETDKSVALRTLISEQLTGCGFYEIMNNSLTASAYYENLSAYPADKSVYLKNPLSSDLNVMRQTLLFGGLESVAYNRNRKNSDLAFYEFGNCYQFDAAKHTDDAALSGYKEGGWLALWLCGNRVNNNWNHADEKSSIFELKGYVLNVLKRLGVDVGRLTMSKAESDVYADALSINTVSGRSLGSLGVVSKKLLKAFDIDTEVYFAELNWDLLLKETRKHKISYTEVSRFPSVKRDLALLVDQAVTFDEIEKVARESERKLLTEVQLFDVYEGKNLPAGKKSYAVSFGLQDNEKTLNEKQIDAIMKKLQSNLEGKLGAQLR